MESTKPVNALKTLKIIHWAITGGPVIFALVVYVQISSSADPQLIDLENILTFLPIGLAVLLVPVSFFMFSSTLKQNLEGKTELPQKLAAFQTAHIIRMAILESGALFAAVGSFITNTYANLGALAVLVLIMVLSAPSVFSLVEKLNLTPEESKLLGG